MDVESKTPCKRYSHRDCCNILYARIEAKGLIQNKPDNMLHYAHKQDSSEELKGNKKVTYNTLNREIHTILNAHYRVQEQFRSGANRTRRLYIPQQEFIRRTDVDKPTINNNTK